MTTASNFMCLVQAAVILVLLLFLYINRYGPLFVSVESLRGSIQISSTIKVSELSTVERENPTTRLFLKPTQFPIGNEDICTFPEVDIYDPEIMKYAKRPAVSCEKKESVTGLVDGVLVNRSPDILHCFGRCLRFDTDNTSIYSDWKATESNFTFDCDIVEARCFHKTTGDAWNKTAPYSYIHTQLLERPIPEPEMKPDVKQYSVYFLVVDSQSHTQLYRNLPKTLDFLTKNMNATNFRWVNIFSSSSRDNAYVWLFGKNTLRIKKERYGLPNMEAEPYWAASTNCKRSAEKDFNVSLVMDFKRRGYVTASVEDWHMVFSYGCAGISSHPFHHIYNPYMTEYEKNYRSWHKKYEKQCLPRHRHALVYLSQFAQSYVDQPKFAFSWFSHVGHNSEWGTKDLDVDMYSFLSLNKNEVNFSKVSHPYQLDRSFVFLLADHGLRFTGAAKTKVGKLDILNPALIIALPKELRGNEELRRVMEENAKNLQTHFDTRATVLDLLKYQPASNFTNHTLLNIEGERGHSYFREQPGPRTCKHLPIHTHECICLQDHTIGKDYLKQNSTRSIMIANFVNKQLNMEIQNSSYADLCDRWILRKLSELTLISDNPPTWQGVLQSSSVEKGGKATFNFFLEALNSTDYRLLSYDRLDLYKNRGDCLNHRILAKVCDCLSNTVE